MDNYAQLPNYVNLTISSGGNTRHYRFNDQQYNQYSNYQDVDRRLFGQGLFSTSICLSLSSICIILLMFENIRYNIFIGLLVIIVLWLSYIEYLDSKIFANADKIDNLLENH